MDEATDDEIVTNFLFLPVTHIRTEARCGKMVGSGLSSGRSKAPDKRGKPSRVLHRAIQPIRTSGSYENGGLAFDYIRSMPRCRSRCPIPSPLCA